MAYYKVLFINDTSKIDIISRGVMIVPQKYCDSIDIADIVGSSIYVICLIKAKQTFWSELGLKTIKKILH